MFYKESFIFERKSFIFKGNPLLFKGNPFFQRQSFSFLKRSFVFEPASQPARIKKSNYKIVLKFDFISFRLGQINFGIKNQNFRDFRKIWTGPQGLGQKVWAGNLWNFDFWSKIWFSLLVTGKIKILT